ncbi:MAG: hypothetical protein ABJL99_10680 [Aliishimia sp.]
MLFEDLMSFLGVGGLLAALIFPLYSGDDFVSKQFGADVREWFLSLKPAKQNAVPELVDSSYTWMLGEKWISVRSGAFASAVYLLAAASIYFHAIAPAMEEAEYLRFDLAGPLDWAIMFAVGIMFTMLSLSWTRYVFRRAAVSSTPRKLIFYIVLDLLFSWCLCSFGFLVLVIAITISQGGLLEPIENDGWLLTVVILLIVAFSQQFSKVTAIFGEEEVIDVYNSALDLDLFSTALWFSTLSFSVVIWVCLAMSLIAKYSMRANSIHSLACYVLPLDEKPIRSVALLIYLGIGMLAGLYQLFRFLTP